MGGVWVGADPGGKKAFGVAIIEESGNTFCKCKTVSSVDEAKNWIVAVASGRDPLGIGIDAPLWWSAAAGGDRLVDKKLRRATRIRSNSVMAVNSLRGAALSGGALLASLMREKFPNIGITESHPKALLQECSMDDAAIAEHFGIDSTWDDDHQRDAAVAAVCAWKGFQGGWVDLADDRDGLVEQDPKSYWLKPVHYWWPKSIE